MPNSNPEKNLDDKAKRQLYFNWIGQEGQIDENRRILKSDAKKISEFWNHEEWKDLESDAQQ